MYLLCMTPVVGCIIPSMPTNKDTKLEHADSSYFKCNLQVTIMSNCNIIISSSLILFFSAVRFNHLLSSQFPCFVMEIQDKKIPGTDKTASECYAECIKDSNKSNVEDLGDIHKLMDFSSADLSPILASQQSSSRQILRKGKYNLYFYDYKLGKNILSLSVLYKT